MLSNALRWRASPWLTLTLDRGRSEQGCSENYRWLITTTNTTMIMATEAVAVIRSTVTADTDTVVETITVVVVTGLRCGSLAFAT